MAWLCLSWCGWTWNPAALGITQRINIWTMCGIVINLVESLVTLKSSFDLKLIQNDIGSEGKRTFRH